MLSTWTRRFSFSFSKQRLYSGLLSGFDNVSDIRNAQFYAKSLDLKSTADFLKTPSYVYEQAKKDLLLRKHSDVKEYLFSLKRNVSDWMDKNEFYDRELIVESIKDSLSLKGQFVCLLGGKSTGKSLLFDHLSKRKNNSKNLSLILLDMRAFGDADILKALLTYLQNTKTEKVIQIIFKTIFSFISKKNDLFKDEALVLLAKAFKDYVDLDVPGEFIEVFKDFKTAELLHLLKSHNINETEVIKDLLRRLSLAFGNITLVIDEANLAFTEDIHHDIARLKKGKKDLEVLTTLSKQSKDVSHFFLYSLTWHLIFCRLMSFCAPVSIVFLIVWEILVSTKGISPS